jgi:DNA-binding response OmpR family regulator
MMKPRILVVADDATLRATLARWLMAAGYAVELAESPKRARDVVADTGITLALVAPDPRGAVGIELASELGGQVEQVIVIEGQADGTSSGPSVQADDGIGGPLSEQIVLARVKAALGAMRIAKPRSAAEVLRFEGFTLDADGRTCVDAKGQDVALTRAEFSLLLALGRQPGRVLSRDELTRVVTGRGAEPDDRSVDVLMSRLRRKIEPDPKTPRLIVTMPGEGYKLTAKPQSVVASATAVPPFGVATVPEAKEALGQGAGAQDVARTASTKRLLQAAPVVVLVVAALGWGAWSNRAALRPATEATPPTISPEIRPPSTLPQPGTAEEGRRATVFKRMVAAMQGDRFDWRTVERLAIEAGVNEAEAHEILAEHPGEVTLGKSRDGKLIARLSER